MSADDERAEGIGLRLPSEEALAEAVADVPLFPLPDLVFFPGTLLPLHIFEPRYRQMTAEVLAAPLPVLVVGRLKAGWENDYYGNPPVHEIAGLGVVIHHEQLDDGRYNLLVQGVARVKLLAPTQDKPYRRVRGRLIADRYPAATDLGVATTALLACCHQLASRLPELGRALRELNHPPDLEPGHIADVLGAALIREPDERQALLETDDVGQRLGRVTTAAATLVASLAPPGRTLN